MGIGRKIKHLREEKRLTKVNLGKLIGVSSVSIDNWEREVKKPSLDAIISLAKIFNISIDALLEFNSFQGALSCDEISLIDTYRSLDDAGKEVVVTISNLEKKRIDNAVDITNTKIRYIPKFANPAAAGITIPYDGEDYEMIMVDDSVPDNADFAVRIQGDSMMPFIKDGDTVFVKRDSSLSIGDVGIFSVDGLIYCKQYCFNEEGLWLKSANRAYKYSDIIIKQGSGSEVKVLGKVLI